MTSSLAEVLCTAVRSALESTSDRLVRVDLSLRWPVAEGMRLLAKHLPDLVVGVLSPFDANRLREHGLNVEHRAAELTALRNVRATDHPSFPLVLLGAATQAEESGLQKISSIVRANNVAATWLGIVQEDLPRKFEGTPLENRLEIAQFVLDRLSNARMQPDAVEDYFEVLLDPSLPQQSKLQTELYLLGLLPDERLIGSASVANRLAENSDFVDSISGGLDTTKRFSRLAESNRQEVTSLLKWLRSRDDSDLRKSDFGVVQEVLAGPRVRPTPAGEPVPSDPAPPGRKLRHFLDVLSDGEIEATTRMAVVDAFVQEMGDEGHLGSSVQFDASVEELDVRLSVDAPTLRDSEWVEEPDPKVDRVTVAADQTLVIVEVRESYSDRSKRVSVPASSLGSLISDSGHSSFDSYLRAREQVVTAGRLLAADEQGVLALLVSSPVLLQACGMFVDAWRQLLLDVLSDGQLPDEARSAFALLDGVWTRDLADNEMFDAVALRWASHYTSAVLAPWHPWRLQPLVQLADEMRTEMERSAVAVGGARWAADRAVPAYNVLEVPPSQLHYSTTDRGSMLFSSEEEGALPPVSGQGGSLARTIGAYAAVHPWSEAGALMGIANPPEGGLVRKLLSRASHAFGHEPALLVNRQRGLRGLMMSDDLQNLVSSVDANDLGRVNEREEIDRDIQFVFVPGRPGTVSALHAGSHSSIQLRLASQGMRPDGSIIYVPELLVGAGAENQLVTLQYQIAGVSNAKSASYELVLRNSQIKDLEAISTRSAWTVVAVPGAVSPFDLHGLSGKALYRVAEYDEGVYKCFVFANSIEPLKWVVEDRLRRLPIVGEVRGRIEALLSDLAAAQPQKLFDLAQNRFGADESLGVMVARELGNAWVRAGTLKLEISLDDASWTQHWLESTGLRADFIVLEVSEDAKAERPVRILVAEAKSTTDEFSAPSTFISPLAEAVTQVEATREHVQGLFSESESLVAAMRMRAFAEHVASAAAYAYSLDESNPAFVAYFSNLSRFAANPAKTVDAVDGIAVALFMNGHEQTQVIDVDGISIISCSSRLLEQVLREEAVEFPRPAVEQMPGYGEPRPVRGPGAEEDYNSGTDEREVAASEGHARADSPALEPARPVSDGVLTPEEEQVAQLSTVLRVRSADVGPLSEARVRLGPTFITASFPLVEGASLAPLQREAADIARDAGFPSVEISNDTERGRIRVLIPRENRVFPAVPPGSAHVVDGNDYLRLSVGQDLGGNDVAVPISQWPHALVSGTTGSGKTTFLRSVLAQLNSLRGSNVNCVVIDGKGESDYFGVLDADVYHENYPEPLLSAESAIDVLKWLREEEVPRRKARVVELARERQSRVDARTEFVRNFQDRAGSVSLFPPLVVVIDEFNELMLRGGSSRQEFVDSVTSIAQAARSVMVHLVLATQRPERAVLPGPIKANLPARFAFRLPTASDSVTVLGHGGAERLLGAGDMLMQLNGQADARLQGYFLEG